MLARVLFFAAILSSGVLADYRDGWRTFPKNAQVLYKGRVKVELESQHDSTLKNYTCKANAHRFGIIELPADQQGPVSGNFHDDGGKVELGRTPTGGCYVIHSEVTKYTLWKIFANEHQDNFDVYVRERHRDFSTIKTSIGNKETIDCSLSRIDSIDYCQILNTTNQVVSNDCKYTIDPVRSEHAGNWTCLMAFKGTLIDFRYTTTLELIDSSVTEERTEGRVITKGDRTYIQCEVINKNAEYKWCRAVSPQGQTFILSSGLMEGRYSAIYTAISKFLDDNLCSLEIEKLTKADHGLWRIEMGVSENDYTGCFIDVPESEKVDRRTSPVETETSVKIGENLIVKCKVPWPSTYCYAISPNRTIIKQDSAAAERLAKIGTCIVTVPNVSINDSGRWTCAIASSDGLEDELFYTNVAVISDRLIGAPDSVSALIGKPAVMLCRSYTKKPLKYCRFVSSQVYSYALRPNASSKSRFSYHGSGLEDGECGIEISKVTNEDIGVWRCAATLKSSYTEESVDITLY